MFHEVEYELHKYKFLSQYEGYPRYRDKKKTYTYEVHTPLRGTSLSFPGSGILTGEYWPSLRGTLQLGNMKHVMNS